jgi:hypothetical protein
VFSETNRVSAEVPEVDAEVLFLDQVWLCAGIIRLLSWFDKLTMTRKDTGLRRYDGRVSGTPS